MTLSRSSFLPAAATNGVSPSSVSMAFADWADHLIASPSKQAELGQSALQKWLLLLQYGHHAWQGECAACVEPLPQDKRFSRLEWQSLPYAALAQAVVLQQQWWSEAMTGVRGVSGHHEEVVEFCVRQWLDMASPSNFIATNPQVLRETVATGGMNLARGFANWSRDALAVLDGGRPRGVETFVPGRQVALTWRRAGTASRGRQWRCPTSGLRCSWWRPRTTTFRRGNRSTGSSGWLRGR